MNSVPKRNALLATAVLPRSLVGGQQGAILRPVLFTAVDRIGPSGSCGRQIGPVPQPVFLALNMEHPRTPCCVFPFDADAAFRARYEELHEVAPNCGR